jgi:protoporphyrinogen oxidase
MKKSIKHNHYAVIGAGPSGLTCAVALARRGYNVTLIEASSRVGGLAKSIKLWERDVDLGPHRFFSGIKEINDFWLELTRGEHHVVKRKTRILYNKHLFNYPLEPINALVGLGLFSSFMCMLSYFRRLLFPDKSPLTFESWVKNRFGDRLFGIFFKRYSEKLWGIPCDKLDAEFATQRIKKFSLSAAVRSAFTKKDGQKHKTLVDQFLYPVGGCGKVYDNAAEEFCGLGGTLLLNYNVSNLEKKDTGFEIQASSPNNKKKFKETFDYVVSTMPIDNLVKFLSPQKTILDALSELKFRNTILCFAEISDAQIFDDQWLYLHSEQVKSGRVTNFNNWDDCEYETTILCFEYWCNEDDEVWSFSSDDAITMVTSDLKNLGFEKDLEVINFKKINIPKSYPIYAAGYKEQLKVVYDFLNNFENLEVIGRYGSFKYNNQDHSILMGLLAARKLMGETELDILNVNEGDDYHEGYDIPNEYDSAD